MTEAPAVSAVIVVDEAARLPAAHAELASRLDALGRPWEVLYLVVPTRQREAAAQARALGAADPGRVRVLEFQHAVGPSAMLRAGASLANAECLLTLPAVPEVDLDVLRDLLAAHDSGADVVVAARSAGRTGRSALVQSRLFNRLVSWAAGTQLRDVASGTRAVRRTVFELVPVYGDFHRYLPVLAHRLGFRVEEVSARPHAGSSRPRVHALRTYLWRALDVLSVLFLCRFTRTPLRLFGGTGAIFAVAGVGLLIEIGAERLAGVPLGNRPLLVLAMLLIGLGVQSFTIGLLGELLLFVNAGNLRDYRISRVTEGAAVGRVSESTVTEAPVEPDRRVLSR